MSYFSCDIPYMSDEELKKSGIHIPEDVSDNNIGNIGYIRKQDMLNAVEKLDIIPSVDGMGIPTDAEDFRVQFLGTVLKVEPADVVPVVRCDDCLFFTTEKSCCRPEGLIKAREDAFCSYGERREE